MIIIAAIFAGITIAAMLLIVAFKLMEFRFIQFKKIERYSYALAGVLIIICGIAVQFLGI